MTSLLVLCWVDPLSKCSPFCDFFSKNWFTRVAHFDRVSTCFQVDSSTDCEGWIYATKPSRHDVKRRGSAGFVTVPGARTTTRFVGWLLFLQHVDDSIWAC